LHIYILIGRSNHTLPAQLLKAPVPPFPIWKIF
jgi:hypothetical protein